MKILNKPIVKLALLGVMALLLLIPANLIKDLIREREYTQEQAITEMTSVWGDEQVLLGPYLCIPFDAPYTVTHSDGSEEVSYTRKYLYVLPEQLIGDSELLPETRNLGIFEAIVYRANFVLSGNFEMPKWDQLGVPKERVLWDKITLNVGIADLRGVEGDITLEWNGENRSFNSGLSTQDLFNSGVQTFVDFKGDQWKFELNTTLRGSKRVSIAPLGKQTIFTMESPWTEPNFEGNFAYSEYVPRSDGFTASWKVSHLNRNYPQAWVGKQYYPSNYLFGTEFVKTVDNYSKTYRVVKYALLVIVLTFLVFYFSEMIKDSTVNSLQYILIGLALVLFYTLLLSFSEHIGFNNAYLVSGLMTVILEFFYARSILKSTKLGSYVASVLALLYVFIFVLIQLKDYALLAGSLGLFVILAGVMFLSRKIKWDVQSPNEQTKS